MYNYRQMISSFFTSHRKYFHIISWNWYILLVIHLFDCCVFYCCGKYHYTGWKSFIVGSKIIWALEIALAIFFGLIAYFIIITLVINTIKPKDLNLKDIFSWNSLSYISFMTRIFASARIILLSTVQYQIKYKKLKKKIQYNITI